MITVTDHPTYGPVSWQAKGMWIVPMTVAMHVDSHGTKTLVVYQQNHVTGLMTEIVIERKN